MKNIIIPRVLDLFATLGENPYSAMWDLIEDFECHGHIVSVKGSTQFGHVVIDGVLRRIDNFGVISIPTKCTKVEDEKGTHVVWSDFETVSNLKYVEMILSDSLKKPCVE